MRDTPVVVLETRGVLVHILDAHIERASVVPFKIVFLKIPVLMRCRSGLAAERSTRFGHDIESKLRIRTVQRYFDRIVAGLQRCVRISPSGAVHAESDTLYRMCEGVGDTDIHHGRISQTSAEAVFQPTFVYRGR